GSSGRVARAAARCAAPLRRARARGGGGCASARAASQGTAHGRSGGLRRAGLGARAAGAGGLAARRAALGRGCRRGWLCAPAGASATAARYRVRLRRAARKAGGTRRAARHSGAPGAARNRVVPPAGPAYVLQGVQRRIFHHLRTEMNWDRIAGDWKQMKGAVRERRGKLTGDELDRMAGQRDQLVGKIQERYGCARDEAEKQVREWENRQQ